MDKSFLLKKNIWTIFIIVFVLSALLFGGMSYNNWKSSKQLVQNEQQTHVELFSNSVRAFLESQESLLEVLGVYLLTHRPLPTKPIHDSVLDNTMDTYPAFLGLGLVAYDGQALVASSNFKLDKLPNLMELEQSKVSFSEARDSKKISTGPTYIINALETQTYAMPIRKAIYIPHDASQAMAVMTAGIKLDNTPIFGGHDTGNEYHQVEIIRGDSFPVFSTDKDIQYTKPVNSDYYFSLKQQAKTRTYFNHFEMKRSGKDFQIITHYDPYLDFWFVSKMDKRYVFDIFTKRFLFGLGVFILYIIVLLALTRSIANTEKQRQKELLYLAQHDLLTDLPNRTFLFEQLNTILGSHPDEEQYYALFFLDIDDFKVINDTHGHEYGDILLQEAASRIVDVAEKGNILARFGGDEFVIIAPSLTSKLSDAKSQAGLIADKLLQTLSETYRIRGYKYTSSVSLGIVLFNQKHQDGFELLRQADIAMYNAKRSGKNSACFFDPKMQQEVTEQFIIESELRTAIFENQFELFYQPQVDVSKRVVGAEALIRWRHPEKGLVEPYKFIPIAEKTGMIIPMGTWVLEAACQRLFDWQQRPETQDLTLSVNVSSKQIREADFVPLVRSLVNKYTIARGQLRLELTETMMVDEIELTIERMNELRGIGVHFSLDDFGTGYSSLQYLKRLPLSQLKIDQSFVFDLESDQSDRAIVKTIISMSQTLGLYTVAEGVETQTQRNYLESKGCLIYQGYLYSKPLPIDEFSAFIISSNS